MGCCRPRCDKITPADTAWPGSTAHREGSSRLSTLEARVIGGKYDSRRNTSLGARDSKGQVPTCSHCQSKVELARVAREGGR
jgi:hypothetical protein